MIAYAFWHTPRAGVDETIYTARLVRFQEELEQAGGGLAYDPQAFRLADVPWINAGRPVYLDVYLMQSSAQMDVLNTAAVSGSMAEPHAAIASMYGSGAGSLYQSRLSDNPGEGWAHAYWFSKPAGMSYAELDAALGQLLPVNASAWRRMMVLGPSPEFWILSPVEVPWPWPAEHRPLTAI
jgi:hypothetical protein